MKKCFFPLLVVLTLLIATVNPAVGFDKKKKKKATPPEIHETVISSVTPTVITITENKATKTFTITQFTEINMNGQKASVTDLKPGMTVSVTMGTDPSRASRISATSKK